MQLSVGLIGAGMWGKNHIRVLSNYGILRKVCDTNPARLAEVSKIYPNLQTTQKNDECFEDTNISAVFVTSSASTHYELARQALLAGKDVFVEKPLALNAHEGKELVKLAKEKNKILMVGHLLHYHPAVQKLKELVLQGELGELRYIASHRLNFGKIRTEENVLWSFAPHDISLILSFYNAMPHEIHVQGGSFLQKNIPDTTLSFFHFWGNKKAHVFVSWLYPFKEQKLVLVGDKKMAVFDDQSSEKLVLYQNEIVWSNGEPQAKRGDRVVISTAEDREPLGNEIEHFLRCCQTRESPLTDGEEGLRVLEVLEECQKQFAIL